MSVHVISTELEKLCGNKMGMFTYSPVVCGVEKGFEVKYDVEGVGGYF